MIMSSLMLTFNSVKVEAAANEVSIYSVNPKAKYSHAIDGGYEIWTALPLFYMTYIEYAIKYEVNGVTYWDNNNGQNYKTYKNGKTKGIN